MILFLISFLSFILLLLSKSLPLILKPLPPWAKEMRMLSFLLLRELAQFILQQLEGFRSVAVKRFDLSSAMATNKMSTQRLGTTTNKSYSTMEMTLLELPELALDYILGKLSPAELSKMACVCRSTRDKCESDYLWERHMREKWGRLMGRAARREWEWNMTSRKDSSINLERNVKPIGWMSLMSCVFPLSWFRPKFDAGFNPRISSSVDSIKSWYQSLESGRFWFPAQVYNRENGHVGFMLSCYDAELSYDCRTDTFHARYPPHGQRAINIEEGVHWDRLRAPAADTPAHDLHVSDCLNDMRPGDHVEIQWRKNKEFPYGWWYGVVGHLDSCDGNGHHCVCHNSDTITLEFNHYNPGSRWRRTVISRADHKEEGNQTDGFYGGIRKLHRKDEISTWKRLWPNEVLE